MDDNDALEYARRTLTELINGSPKSREELEDRFGPNEVWDTEQLKNDFENISFLAPFCTVTRKKDKVKGMLVFQHHPRFYFAFKELT